MSPRVVTIVAGIVITGLGIIGLLYPERALFFIGLAYANPSHMAAALGEVRATYGGLFIVMGVATLFAAVDPPVHRARLLFVGLMWLGMGAGRLFGVYADGNPGLFGWAAVIIELALGGALVAAAQGAASSVDTLEPSVRAAETSYDVPPTVVPPA
ncbi:MAG TPA: DUF4345 domain-containing protein [Candidatus Binatia bacterium]|jgi:hypothetical protein